MPANAETLIPTRMTLIERLKDWDDSESWREFFETYWRLIYSVAIRSGLRPEEAQEVVQETIISVSRNIGKFKADPAFGSFKSWLLTLTGWRIKSQFRKRSQEEVGRAHLFNPRFTDDSSTATEEKLPDTSGGFDAIWDEEWQQNLRHAALEKLKRQVSAKHYQIFYTHVVEGMPAARVAKMLGTNVGQVYLLTLRLRPKLQKALRQVEASQDR